MRRGFCVEVLGAVLANHGHAGLGEHADLLECDVLDRGQHLHALADLVADSREVVGDAARVEAADQLRHASPAWRPVTPRSRRWEKKRSASWIVHRPQSWTVSTPASVRRSRAIPLRSTVRPLVPNAARTSSPTS